MMTKIKLTLAALLLSLAACDADERLEIVDFECDEAGCSGRWVGTAMRSKVYSAEVVLAFPNAPAAWTYWECMPEIDADACVAVDDHGHMGCVRIYGEWAVPVSPSCAYPEPTPERLFVGAGMVALVEAG